MGPASPPGRVLSALSGAALVYGPVEAATAPGQIPLEELLDVYAVDAPRPIEALYGIVGADVAGSLSPRIHNALFRARSLPRLYLPLPVADWDRARPQDLAFDPAFRGFSVTQPWKLAAAASAARSEDVAQTKAANTLVRAGGTWRAENTDVDGIFDPLADHDTGEGRTAVILGTGGAARAAVRRGAPPRIRGARRGPRDAAADASRAERCTSTRWRSADLPASEADLYVNATPVGSRAGDPPAFPRTRSREPPARLRLRLPARRVGDADGRRGARGAVPGRRGHADVRRAGRAPGAALRRRRTRRSKRSRRSSRREPR